MALNTYRDLRTYQHPLDLCVSIFEMTKQFPVEERFSLIDQVRRSSRSVCSDLAEGWQKRRYSAAFVAKLNDAEGEAAETQVWLDISRRCGYLDADKTDRLRASYDHVIAQLEQMMRHPEKWVLQKKMPGKPSDEKTTTMGRVS